MDGNQKLPLYVTFRSGQSGRDRERFMSERVHFSHPSNSVPSPAVCAPLRAPVNQLPAFTSYTRAGRRGTRGRERERERTGREPRERSPGDKYHTCGCIQKRATTIFFVQQYIQYGC